MQHTTDRRHSQWRRQSAHTNRSRPLHQRWAVPVLPPGHAGAIQAHSSCTSTHRRCADRTRSCCTSTVSHRPRCPEDRWRTQSRRRCKDWRPTMRTSCKSTRRSRQSADCLLGMPSKRCHLHCTYRRTRRMTPAPHWAPGPHCTGCTCCRPSCTDRRGIGHTRHPPHSAAGRPSKSRRTTSPQAPGGHHCADACR